MNWYGRSGLLYSEPARAAGSYLGEMFSGKRSYQNTVDSNQAQIAYDEYIRQGNVRAYDDWQRNVGSKGRTIRYPELSYPGQIYKADTAVARSLYNSDSAYANYYGNVPFRAAGLYGVFGKPSHYL